MSNMSRGLFAGFISASPCVYYDASPVSCCIFCDMPAYHVVVPSIPSSALFPSTFSNLKWGRSLPALSAQLMLTRHIAGCPSAARRTVYTPAAYESHALDQISPFVYAPPPRPSLRLSCTFASAASPPSPRMGSWLLVGFAVAHLYSTASLASVHSKEMLASAFRRAHTRSF